MERNNKIESEYREFLQTGETKVPELLSEKILSHVHKALNPTIYAVFLKMSAIHLVVGASTLLLCPQFGVSLTSSMGLMSYLMQYGESVCMLGCGAFFVGASLLVASLFLRPEEVRALQQSRVLQITSLATLSLGVLAFLGEGVVLSMALAWILGAVLGGTIMLQLGWYTRRLVILGTI